MQTITRRTFLKWIAGAAMTGIAATIAESSLTQKLSNATVHAATLYKATSTVEKGMHVALLSDLHVQLPGYFRSNSLFNKKAADAINDLGTFNPAAFILLGDNIHHGFPQEYDILHNILGPAHARKIPIYPTLGNHEYYNRRLNDREVVDLFKKQWGLTKPYYNVILAGVHFVFLSPEYRRGYGVQKDWAWLTRAQLQWLDSVLTEHVDKDTLVFLHQPLNDTVEQSQYIDWIARTAQTTDILALIRRHPQIRAWFSGHTHAPLTSANQMINQNGVWFLGGSSTFYTNSIRPRYGSSRGPFLGNMHLGKQDYHSSESRFISIYKDKIIVRGRDHVKREWEKQYLCVLYRKDSKHAQDAANSEGSV